MIIQRMSDGSVRRKPLNDLSPENEKRVDKMIDVIIKDSSQIASKAKSLKGSNDKRGFGELLSRAKNLQIAIKSTIDLIDKGR